MNLLESVKGVLTNTVVEKAASALGIENGMMKSAMKMFLPAIIGGVINKGSGESGAGGLIDLFKKGGFGDGNLSDLMGVLGDSDKQKGMLETGTDLLGTIFGGNKSGLLDMLLKTTGISKSSGSSLLSFLAPIVINKLAGMVFGKNMSAAGLSSYLGEQKDDIMGLVPGLSAMLGGTETTVKESLGAAAGAAHAKTSGHSDSEGGGMGWLKWLLPLLLVAALLYWWSSRDKGEIDATTDTTEQVESTDVATSATETTATTNTSADATSNAATSGLSINSNGDVLNANGAIVYAAGSYQVDADGNLVSSDGKILMNAADISSDFMARLKAAIGSLTGSATPTMENMKVLFGNMMTTKTPNSSYALSNIEFNQEDHKISNFSKAEVMGLAEALKANVNGKIEVQVHTNDGKDEKESNKLSETRANVVRDMLVTLGVNKKQISAKGMGRADAAKAQNGKVDIVIK